MAARLRFLISTTLILPLVAGCSVFDASLLDGGAGEGGGPDGGPDGGPACELRKPPPPPDAEDGEDVEEVVFALREIALDLGRGEWRSVGYDIDGYCTLPDDLQTGCNPPEGAIETDGEQGIDNSFAHNIFPIVNLAFDGELESTARQNQTDGFGSILLRLRDWNGEANDPRVTAVISQTVFGTPADADGSEPEIVIEDGPEGDTATLPDGGTPPPPAWDGTDWWWARTDTFLDDNPELPRVEDREAYVADRTVVAHIGEKISLVFTGGDQGVLVRITDVTATFTFSEDLSTISATVAGRWSADDILLTAQAVGVCPGTSEYGVAETQLEESADVLAMPGGGGQCDAVSLGTTLQGVRAHWGGLMDAKPLPNLCAEMDGGTPDGG